MDIIETCSNSREGNDCYIHDEWVLARVCGERRVLRFLEARGWGGRGLEMSQVTEPDYDTPERVKEWFDKI